MPELPEVEIVRIGLDSLLPGKVIQNVVVDNLKSFPNSQADTSAFVINSTIKNVDRRGKVLLINLKSKYTLMIHLKMTGQLVFRANDDSEKFGAGHPNDSLIGRLPDKSTRVIFDLGNHKLFFNDQRKFGWIRLVPSQQVHTSDFISKLGPELLDGNLSWQDFKIRIHRRQNSNIKAVLLDQSIVAGVGNIYADESLFLAGIHPKKLVKQISDRKVKLLYEQLIKVLKLSIKKGGSTDRNYVNAKGQKGSYMRFAGVFRRDGQPCKKCGSVIIKIRVAGRGTHLCPHCQKL